MTFRDDVKQRLIAYRNPPEETISDTAQRLVRSLAEAFALLEKQIAAQEEKYALKWLKVEI